MSRCKACNKAFSDSELRATNPITCQPEDLCGICRRAVSGFYTPKEDARSLVATEAYDLEYQLDTLDASSLSRF